MPRSSTGKKRSSSPLFLSMKDHFAKTGSGQAQGKLKKRRVFSQQLFQVAQRHRASDASRALPRLQARPRRALRLRPESFAELARGRRQPGRLGAWDTVRLCRSSFLFPELFITLHFIAGNFRSAGAQSKISSTTRGSEGRTAGTMAIFLPR